MMTRISMLLVSLFCFQLSYAQLPTLLNHEVIKKPNCNQYDSAEIKLTFSSGIDTGHAICINRQFDTVIYSANRDTATILNLKYDTSVVTSFTGYNGNDPNYATNSLYAYGWLHDQITISIDSSKSNCVSKVPRDTVKVESGIRWLSGTPWYPKACGRNDTIDLDFLGPSPVQLTINNSTFHEFSNEDIRQATNGQNCQTVYSSCTAYNFKITMANGCPAYESGQVNNHTGYINAFHIYINPIYNPDTVDHLVCKGDTVRLSDYKFAASTNNVLLDYKVSPKGCDTTRYHNIKVIQPLDSAVYDTVRICPGDTAWMPDGSYLLGAGKDTSILNSNAVCDSVILTEIIEWPTYFQQQNDTACYGQTYYFLDGDSASAPGIDTSLFQSVNGCDSTIETTLTFIYTYSKDTADHAICLGDSILIGSNYILNAGLATDTVSGACDTVRYHQIQVINPYANSKYNVVNICPGDTAFFPDLSYSTSAVLDTSILKGSQCDSIIITRVNMLSPFFTQFADTICQGTVYTFPDGDTSTIAIQDTSLFMAGNGCDSVVVVDLMVNTHSSTSSNQNICMGTWYVFADGDSSNMSVIDTSVFSNSVGCDSLVIVNLQVDSISFTQQNVSICYGEWYTFADGDSSNVATTDTSLLTNAAGCDSIVYTTLGIIQIDTSVNQIGDTLFAISNYDGYQWLSCSGGTYQVMSGDTSFKISPLQSGDFAVAISEEQCKDTTACYAIQVTPIIAPGVGEFQSQKHWLVYPNPFEHELSFDPPLVRAEIRMFDMTGRLLYAASEQDGTTIQIELPAGEYILEVVDGEHTQRYQIVKQ